MAAENADESLVARVEAFKNGAIEDLFAFYRLSRMKNFEERFGTLLLLISGVVATVPTLKESFQIMRVFAIVPFDALTERILFISSQTEE